MNIFKLFSKPKLSQEAFLAYLNRLPDFIQVEWQRDGNFIIGTVKAEGNEFITQGINAKDFIEMVNDAIYTLYDIPVEYVKVVKQFRAYEPRPEERARLEDAKISYSIFSLSKSDKVPEIARQ